MAFLVQDKFEMYLWKCYQQGNSKITWFWHFAKLNERGQNKLKFIYSWKHWLVLWTKNKDSLYQKLWMEHKCGQISIQHTKVFSVTWDQKNFCQLLSEKGKKECLKSRTDVVEQQNKSFSNKCPLDSSRLAIDVSKILKSRKNFASWLWCQKISTSQQIDTTTSKVCTKTF